MVLVFDHLAVSCQSLDEGTAAVLAALGVAPSGGGRHPDMGTHNRLLSLGPDAYLEVIAIDPDAPAPPRPRWFDLDRFFGPPRLTNWVCRCSDLAGELAALPGAGRAMALSRGGLRWSMAVPGDGRLPFDGCHPALIEWRSSHPAAGLPETGCRLRALSVAHPDADRLERALSLDDGRIEFQAAPEPGLLALIETPDGPRRLR